MKKEYVFEMVIIHNNTGKENTVETTRFLVNATSLKKAQNQVDKYNRLSHESVNIGRLIEVNEI